MRQAARQLLEENLQLHPREVLAHALVRAVAEGQMVAGIVAMDVEQVGVMKVPLVVIARGHDHQDLRAGGQHDATDADILQRDAPPRDDRAGKAQALFDRIRKQRRIVGQFVPGARVLQQQPQCIRGGIRRSFVRGDDTGHHHRMQVGVSNHVRMFGLQANAVSHPARPGRIAPHLFEDAARQLPEITDRVRHAQLFLLVRSSPGVERVRDRVLPQQRHVVLVDAEEVQRDGQRHFPQHLVDQIGAAVVDKAVDVIASQLARQRLMLTHGLGCERVDQQAPSRHVRRFVLVDQRAVHRVVVRGQHLLHRRGWWRDLFQRIGRAEAAMVAEDFLDVVIAGDDPVTQLRAEKHRLLRARPLQVAGRVLRIGVTEGIERGRLLTDRAAARIGRTRGPACFVCCRHAFGLMWSRTTTSASTVTTIDPPSRFR